MGTAAKMATKATDVRQQAPSLGQPSTKLGTALGAMPAQAGGAMGNKIRSRKADLLKKKVGQMVPKTAPLARPEGAVPQAVDSRRVW